MDQLVSCPGCRAALRVPADVAGVVGCPHCAARFRPTPAGPVVIRRLPQRLILPALGLVFLGLAGLLVNGVIAARTLGDPAAAREVARAGVRQDRLLEALAAANRNPQPGADYPYAPAAAAAGVAAATLTRDHLDEVLAEARAPAVGRRNAQFAAVSGVVLVGGLCVLFGRFLPLAVLGCVAAAVNLNHMCFAPGLLVGGWGLLTLARDDVRPYFRRGG